MAMSLLRNNPGRTAGFLYLLLLAAPLRLIYIPSVVYVRGDATATAANITAHETLFRLGLVSELFTATMLIFLVLAFYRLFKGVSQYLAVLVIILGGVMPACMSFFNVVHDAAALILVKGADYLSVFDKPQRDALAMLFLRLHGQTTTAAMMLWGAWLFPLGLLVYRARFLPRFIGVWLLLNGVAYVVTSLTGLLWPEYQDTVSNVTFPVLFGELALMLWLGIKGVTQEAVDARTLQGETREA
jgi:hypothetical protein